MSGCGFCLRSIVLGQVAVERDFHLLPYQEET